MLAVQCRLHRRRCVLFSDSPIELRCIAYGVEVHHLQSWGASPTELGCIMCGVGVHNLGSWGAGELVGAVAHLAGEGCEGGGGAAPGGPHHPGPHRPLHRWAPPRQLQCVYVCMYVCVCVHAYMCLHVCVCGLGVCVCVSESESESETGAAHSDHSAALLSRCR